MMARTTPCRVSVSDARLSHAGERGQEEEDEEDEGEGEGEAHGGQKNALKEEEQQKSRDRLVTAALCAPLLLCHLSHVHVDVNK